MKDVNKYKFKIKRKDPGKLLDEMNVFELESLIRSAECIFGNLVNVGILSFFVKLKDRYEVAYRAF